MKRLALKILIFFVFSNLFIACCAAVMVYQSYALLLDAVPDLYFLFFVFFATLASYSFHWYLTPAQSAQESTRLRWLHKHRAIHFILFWTGTAGATFFAFFLRQHWLWLAGAAVVTFLYSAPKIPHPLFRALRKIALGKTIFLAFVWMYITTLLPIQISEKPWQPAFYLFAASRFFLIYAICILFDYRDRDYDRSIGIKSLVTWLNEKGIQRLFVSSLVLFFILTLSLHFFMFDILTITILILPGIGTGILYSYAIKRTADMLYYLVLDGLMAFSAIITFLQNF